MSEPRDIVDIAEKAVHMTPFLIGATQNQYKFAGTRVLEAVIMAVIAGAVSMLFSVLHIVPQIKLEQQYAREEFRKDVSYVRESISELKQEVKEVKSKVDFLNATRK